MNPLTLALAMSLANATEDATDSVEAPTIAIGAPLRGLALPLPEDVLEAQRLEDWPAALQGLLEIDPGSLDASVRGDWAFLVGWAAVAAQTPEAAVVHLPELSGSSAPEAHLSLVRGELLRVKGDTEAALDWLAAVDPDSPVYPAASLAAVQALRDLDREDEAWQAVARVVERADPAPGNAAALLALAQHHGPDTDEAYTYARRLWTHYPHTDEGLEAQELLKAYPDRPPTWQQVAVRAEVWMLQGGYDEALAETAPYLGHADEASADGCRLKFTRARSLYKRNKLTASIGEFSGIGEQCAGVPSISYGPRGLYVLGTAQFRRKQFGDSADTYRELAERFSDHSMADDAWTRGGISLLEGGRADEAQQWWARALEDYPDGDTVPEAILRLAFSRYDDGYPEEAIGIAEQLMALPPQDNAVHIEAGHYWSARWRLYPDATQPRMAVDDPAARAAAVEGWRQLCVRYPHSFYAILAHSRLLEEAPDVAATLADARPDPVEEGPWQVRLAFLTDPDVRDGIALMRLGLSTQALALWGRVDQGAWWPDEKAWTTELRIAAGDWLLAHDDLRSWIVANPLTTLGPRQAQIVRVAYPARYWDEVQDSVEEDYRYEARLFHGLVREESNFNREIVSFAGAIGLSQLMWATAQQTAGWLDMPLRKADLNEPAINLRIGARYLDAMHRQLSNSPFLALAAYNGGARNVNRWVDEHDNPPTDEWVERIPYRETRGYVKRVMGTWQTMRYHFDTGRPFPDLSAYNHHAKP